MFKDLRLGQFMPGNSFVHKLDPGTKLWGTAVLVLLVFLPAGWPGLMAVVLLLAGIIALAGVPLKHYLTSVKALWPIFLVTLVINSLTFPGKPLARLGPVVLSSEGVDAGLFMACRLALAVLVTGVFTFTTSPVDLTDRLERLFKPLARLGFPGHEVALTMTIAIRFVPAIMEEGDRLVKALQARGADLGRGGPLKRARSFMPLLIPLLIGAFRRADDLALAMEVRCYRGGDGRTRYREMRLTGPDYLVLTAVTCILLFVLGVRLFGR